MGGSDRLDGEYGVEAALDEFVVDVRVDRVEPPPNPNAFGHVWVERLD